MGKTILCLSLAVVTSLLLAGWLSPWPSVWVIRAVFDKGAAEAAQALEKHLPANIRSRTALAYDPADVDALLDIHAPATLSPSVPTVVWVHGGGFVSGRRSDISNYLKVLAGRGFVTVNVDYTLAPSAHYPTPVRQLANALAYLDRHADELGINRSAVVLAGDSAGAQIAAQMATVITDADYADRLGISAPIAPDQLKGTLLFCGVFDLTALNADKGGVLGWFLHTVAWAYSGARDWRDVPRFDMLSITPHVGPQFPPTFISAGNADPLAPQSIALHAALRAHGVAVEGLFFPADQQPALPHEYQFNLDQPAGRLALDRAVVWLQQRHAVPLPASR